MIYDSDRENFFVLPQERMEREDESEMYRRFYDDVLESFKVGWSKFFENWIIQFIAHMYFIVSRQ